MAKYRKYIDEMYPIVGPFEGDANTYKLDYYIGLEKNDKNHTILGMVNSTALTVLKPEWVSDVTFLSLPEDETGKQIQISLTENDTDEERIGLIIIYNQFYNANYEVSGVPVITIRLKYKELFYMFFSYLNNNLLEISFISKEDKTNNIQTYNAILQITDDTTLDDEITTTDNKIFKFKFGKNNQTNFITNNNFSINDNNITIINTNDTFTLKINNLNITASIFNNINHIISYQLNNVMYQLKLNLYYFENTETALYFKCNTNGFNFNEAHTYYIIILNQLGVDDRIKDRIEAKQPITNYNVENSRVIPLSSINNMLEYNKNFYKFDNSIITVNKTLRALGTDDNASGGMSKAFFENLKYIYLIKTIPGSNGLASSNYQYKKIFEFINNSSDNITIYDYTYASSSKNKNNLNKNYLLATNYNHDNIYELTFNNLL